MELNFLGLPYRDPEPLICCECREEIDKNLDGVEFQSSYYCRSCFKDICMSDRILSEYREGFIEKHKMRYLMEWFLGDLFLTDEEKLKILEKAFKDWQKGLDSKSTISLLKDFDYEFLTNDPGGFEDYVEAES